MDYNEDLSFFKKLIISDLDVLNADTQDIINYVLNNEIFHENMHLNEDYFINFTTEKMLEIKGANNG